MLTNLPSEKIRILLEYLQIIASPFKTGELEQRGGIRIRLNAYLSL